MSDTRNIYEGLFLFPQTATSDLRGAADHVQQVLSRAEAEVVAFSKWDERRLAYEIKGNKRGLYFLVYFRAEPGRLAGIERDCNLSEQLLRAMVTRADYIPADAIEATDGRTKLEDEIKLRGEQKEGVREAGVRSRVTTAKDREEEEKKAEAEKVEADAPAETDSESAGEAPAEATDDKADAPAGE